MILKYYYSLSVVQIAIECAVLPSPPSLLLLFLKIKSQTLEREAKDCRVRTEEWYALFILLK